MFRFACKLSFFLIHLLWSRRLSAENAAEIQDKPFLISKCHSPTRFNCSPSYLYTYIYCVKSIKLIYYAFHLILQERGVFSLVF